jgi:hypothetical protein
MPAYLSIALGTILAIGGIASYIAGHEAAGIAMIAVSAVFDVLFVLAVRDARKR